MASFFISNMFNKIYNFLSATKPPADDDGGMDSSTVSDSEGSGVFFYSTQPRRHRCKPNEPGVRPANTGNEARDEFVRNLYAHMPRRVEFCAEDRKKLEAHERRKAIWRRMKKALRLNNKCRTCGALFADNKKRLDVMNGQGNPVDKWFGDDLCSDDDVCGKVIASDVIDGIDTTDMAK